ncbi:MAG: hypothetical protein IJ324_01575 [Lachnospiraceae bacterium]|nr:hypothetical protein [Lachnospiraceae bacterium]
MKKKRSKFWSFWLSFVPGCVEMYMGFLKRGISMFALFVGIIAVAVFLNIGELMLVDVIVWVYGFFSARNLVHLEDSEIAILQDDYLFHVEGMGDLGSKLAGKYRSFIAVLLILFGSIMLLRVLISMLQGLIPDFVLVWLYSVSNYLPQLVIGVGIVALGMWLIRGKKQELLEDHNG